MSRYILIRRLYGPMFLLLVGVNALLNQAHILYWSQTWPFYLILWGMMKLAERAALASEGYPQWPQPQAGWQQAQPTPTQPYPPAPAPGAPQQTQSTQVIPSIPVEIVKDPEGGRQ